MENYIEKITTYLNNTFAAFPQTEQAVKLKNDMLSSMTDKFNELTAGGMSEDAAFGRVIGQFGSVDEIKDILGINNTNNQNTFVPSNMTVLPVTEERRQAYEKSKTVASAQIAAGVVCCILGLFCEPFFAIFFIEELCEFIFGGLIAAGVFLFIKAGLTDSRFFEVKEPVYYAQMPSQERLQQYFKFLDKRAWLIPTAVALFIMSAFVVPFIMEMFSNAIVGEAFSFLIFSLFIAAGVAILVMTAGLHSRFSDVRVRRRKR